jgi:putative DNA primase/helicase
VARAEVRSPGAEPGPELRVVASVPGQSRPRSDLGNAERLVDRFGDQLRYCRQQALWRFWDGRRWAADVTGEAERRAKATVRAIYGEARHAQDPEERAALARWALSSEAGPRLRAVLALAQTEAEIAVGAAELDRHPFLLATDSGTIDLRSGALRTADPSDLITHLAPVAYDPTAACRRWEAFLGRILPDPEVRAFLQRSAGYCLTGSMAEQCLWILWGTGRNGKSTFLTTLQAVLGDYAMQAPATLLVDRRRDAAPFDLAGLAGRRLVAMAETEEVGSLTEGLIKQLTGGEPVRARHLYGDFFEFEVQAKIWLSTNHRPTVRGEDEGIWRRIHLVPFTERIAEDELDKDLPHKLRAELPGILAWAVRGCLAWQQGGLRPPRAVTLATSEYRKDESVLERFVEETCLLGSGQSVPKKLLYHVYQTWCDDQGLTPLSQPRLSRALKERAVREARLGRDGAHCWIGLALRAGSSPGR